VQDEIVGVKGGAPVRWGMVTAARIALDGERATLTQDGATLRAEILAPAGAAFEIASTDPQDPENRRKHTHRKENRNRGTSMLVVRLKPAGRAVRLAVLLTPVGTQWKELPPPAIHALSRWVGRIDGQTGFQNAATTRVATLHMPTTTRAANVAHVLYMTDPSTAGPLGGTPTTKQ
jgi:hypothetical protein